MTVSGEDASVPSSSSPAQVLNTSSVPETTPVLSVTTSAGSRPDLSDEGASPLSRTPVTNRSQVSDRVAVENVSKRNKTLPPRSLLKEVKPAVSSRVTGRSALSGNASVPKFGLQNATSKNTTSPTIRLGLSRNARVPPLHPRPLSRTQKLT